MTRARGYIDSWRPQAKTLALLDQVDAVLDEYADHLPLTGRQVFYRLVGAHGYPKDEQAYNRLLEVLVKARRSRRIAMDVIRDDGISEHRRLAFTGKTDFYDAVANTAAGYTRDRLAGQPQSLEVWCEAAGMAPQLARVAHPYGVPVYSSSGFDSLTAKYAIAMRAAGDGRPLVVLHIGDHDPSGVHLFTSAAEDVAALAAAHGGIVEFHRVAVTPEQVVEHNLPTAPPKRTDRRAFTGETTQAESLDPATLASIVTRSIEQRIDDWAFRSVVAAETAERAELLEEIEALR